MPTCPKVTRLKYICELIVDCEHKTAPTQETGYPLIRTPNIGLGHLILNGVNRVSEEIYQEWSRRTIPQAEDLILAREAPVGNVAIIPKNMKVCLGQRTVLIRPDKNKTCSTFLVYLMLGDDTQARLLERSTGATVHHLNMTDIRNLELPTLPPLPVQTQIAAFLDRKTGQIDELICIKERRIELLQEQRTALINHVVTKGLDPTVEMKPSGLEWIGEIPLHWEVINTKYLFQLVTEPAPKNNDYELLSIYTDVGVRPRKELEERGNRATTTDGYWLVKKDDFIVNKLLAWMGAIGLSNYEGVTSPAYDILRKIRPLNERFYEYLFRCGLYFTEFKKRSRGIMEVRLRLYFDQFGQIALVFPPVNEQDKIVNFLDHKAKQIDDLLSTEQRKIDLLKEYRQSLISEAVTGKIDVRNEV